MYIHLDRNRNRNRNGYRRKVDLTIREEKITSFSTFPTCYLDILWILPLRSYYRAHAYLASASSRVAPVAKWFCRLVSAIRSNPFQGRLDSAADGVCKIVHEADQYPQTSGAGPRVAMPGRFADSGLS